MKTMISLYKSLSGDYFVFQRKERLPFYFKREEIVPLIKMLKKALEKDDTIRGEE